MRSVTLIGHGYIGNAICAEFEKQGIVVYRASHRDFPGPDILNPIRHTIIGNLGLIINAAGYTGKPNVDACETDKAACIAGNVVWPLNLHSHFRGLPILHIGSGCIYQGDNNYAETDTPNFEGSFYSLCKSVAERSLREHLHSSYILRIRMPFGSVEHDKNYLTKLQRYPKLVDVKNSISCIEDVARVVVHFVLNRPEPGLYNVVNPGAVTTRMVADMLGLEKEWFESEEAFTKAVKAPRSNCTLAADKLAQVYPIRDVLSALEETIRCLKSR